MLPRNLEVHIPGISSRGGPAAFFTDQRSLLAGVTVGEDTGYR
jgi:hypothetical protein